MTTHRLTIRLFGSFDVLLDGAPLKGLHRREGPRLLAYLALNLGNTLPYSDLASRFWPGEAHVSASGGEFSSTRQAVYTLKQSLQSAANCLKSPTRGAVLLDPEGVDVDLIAFSRLAQEENVASWREAIGLYRGPLLEGWSDSWVKTARQTARNRYERLLRRLLEAAWGQGDIREAEGLLRRLLGSSPQEQEAARRLMRLLGDQSRYVEAREVFEALVEGLRAGGQEPEEETRALAEEVRRRGEAHPVSTSVAPSGASLAGETRPTVAILYRRGVQPDESVVDLLSRTLPQAGYEVFIDRALVSGVEWMREIERQIRGAHAVVPLLSSASVGSEMLEHEVETAYTAAQLQGGRPRLLPVRIAHEEPLPAGSRLAAILNPLQYTLWHGPDDDDVLLETLRRSLRTEPVEPPPLEPPGGAVALNSRYYIVRPTDDEFYTSVARRDSIVLLKGARQMGKTSLLARGMEFTRQAGARVILTDFQTLSERHLADPKTLAQVIAVSLADQLGLDVSPRDDWDEEFDPGLINLERFLRRYVLTPDAGWVIWGLDEVDRLYSCPFYNDVFGLFRSWHNRRALDPSGPWSRLTLAIAYATEAHLFITDINQSPFNVGSRLSLADFTAAQIAELNQRYGEPLRSQVELTRFHALVSGHPYLSRRGLDAMVGRGVTLDTLETQGDREDGPFGDHLRRLLAVLSREDSLLEAMRTLLRGERLPDSEQFYRLRSAGLLAGDILAEAHPRCRLYTAYFTRQLL